MVLAKKKSVMIFFVFLLLLFFIYGVSYKFTFSVPTTYISALILLFFYAINTAKKKLTIEISTLKLPLFFALLLFFVSFVSYIYNSNSNADLYMMKTSFMYIISLLLIPYVITCFFEEKTEILLYFGGVGVVNAIFIILMLFVKPFQLLYLSVIDSSTFELIGGNDAIDSLMSLRLVGITGFSAYMTGFSQSILALALICYMYMSPKKINAFHYVSLGVIMISAICVARSAIIGILIIIFVSMCYFSFSRILKIIFIIALVGGISSWAVISLLPYELGSFFIHWVSEFVLSGMETGSVKSNVSMFIYSFSDFDLLGFSRWYGEYGEYFMNTDVGWYRVLFSIGYLGLIFWVAFFISLIGFNTLFNKNNMCILGWAILAYVFVMMFKGAILFDNYQSIFVIGMIFFITKEKKIGGYKRC